MKKIPDYRPEILSFTSWAGVMIFELLGSRILGPYVGTSLFIWTWLIAIVLWALALWYYVGGKYADSWADMKSLSKILLYSSLTIVVLLLVKTPILVAVVSLGLSLKISSLVLVTILFSPTSFLLWMIGPIVTKIRITQLDTSGAAVGKISSLGTIGSIIWTLWAGFFLIPFFWINTLLILLWLSFLFLSYMCERNKYLIWQILLWMILCINFLWVHHITQLLANEWTYIYETAYSHIEVSQRYENSSIPREIRDLRIDNVTHAGMYLESDELVYPYTRYYHLFDTLLPESENMLMLGWSAYSFPKSFLKQYKDKNLDVVEIDEKATEIAKKHFRLTDNPRLNIYHQDARVYLNNSNKKYDAILWDAFGSYLSIPYQLTTLELVKKKYDLLNENWIVILNLIAWLEWDKAQFLNAQYKTYQQVFPEVFIMPVSSQTDIHRVQNIILIAAKNPDSLNYISSNDEHIDFLSRKRYLNIPENTKILTDDFAPVDYYISQLQ